MWSHASWFPAAELFYIPVPSWPQPATSFPQDQRPDSSLPVNSGAQLCSGSPSVPYLTRACCLILWPSAPPLLFAPYPNPGWEPQLPSCPAPHPAKAKWRQAPPWGMFQQQIQRVGLQMSPHCILALLTFADPCIADIRTSFWCPSSISQLEKQILLLPRDKVCITWPSSMLPLLPLKYCILSYLFILSYHRGKKTFCLFQTKGIYFHL